MVGHFRLADEGDITTDLCLNHAVLHDNWQSLFCQHVGFLHAELLHRRDVVDLLSSCTDINFPWVEISETCWHCF